MRLTGKWSLIAAALAAAAVRSGFATTIKSDGFEAYPAGSTLEANGWSKSGSGADAIGTAAGLAHSGTHFVQLTPPAGTSGTYLYQTNVFTPGGSEPALTAAASIAFLSPTSGAASRGVVAGLSLYDSHGDLMADVLVEWDPQNTLQGGGANHYYIVCDWRLSPSDAVTHGFHKDLGAVTSDGLTAMGYQSISTTLDYSSGELAFFLGRNELLDSQGSARPRLSGYPDFSDADLYFERGATSGTLPRICVDDYSVSTSAGLGPPVVLDSSIPPALVPTGLALRRRRARCG